MQSDHWIKVTNSCRNLYFAGSFGREMYKLLKQQYKLLKPEPLEANLGVCAFNTRYAVFHLLKFRQEVFAGFHDVKILLVKSDNM